MFEVSGEHASSPPFKVAPPLPPASEPDPAHTHETAVELADQLAAPIAVVQHGRVVFANAALAEYLGYPRAATLVGLTFEQFAERHLIANTTAADLGSPDADPRPARTEEHELRHLDGGSLSAECTLKAVVFANQRATACVWHDTTRTRSARARSARARHLTSLSKLAAGVAHEVNNPLAYMAVNLDLALEELTALRAVQPPGAAERLADIELALNDVREGVRRVGRTIDDLNALALSGRSDATSVDLAALLDSVLASLEPRMPPGTRIRRAYAEVARVRGGEAWLERALHELLLNAIQALAAARGERVLGLTIGRAPGDFVCASIEDTGPGVNSDELERVFEPYYGTRAFGGGRGLGLSIAYGIITSFGGSLDLDSQPGRGTRASVRLPISR